MLLTALNFTWVNGVVDKADTPIHLPAEGRENSSTYMQETKLCII